MPGEIDAQLDEGAGALQYFREMLAIANRIAPEVGMPDWAAHFARDYDRERGIELAAMRTAATALRKQSAATGAVRAAERRTREGLRTAWPDGTGAVVDAALRAYGNSAEPVWSAVRGTGDALDRLPDRVSAAVSTKVRRLAEFTETEPGAPSRAILKLAMRSSLDPDLVRDFLEQLHEDIVLFDRIIVECTDAVQEALTAVAAATAVRTGPFPAPALPAPSLPLAPGTTASGSGQLAGAPAAAPAAAPVAGTTAARGPSPGAATALPANTATPFESAGIRAVPKAAPAARAFGRGVGATPFGATPFGATQAGATPFGATPVGATAAGANPGGGLGTGVSGFGSSLRGSGGIPSRLAGLLPELGELLKAAAAGAGGGAESSSLPGDLGAVRDRRGDSEAEDKPGASGESGAGGEHGAGSEHGTGGEHGADCRADGATGAHDAPGPEAGASDGPPPISPEGRTAEATVSPDGKSVEVTATDPDGTVRHARLHVGPDGHLSIDRGDTAATAPPPRPDASAGNPYRPAPEVPEPPAPRPSSPEPSSPEPSSPEPAAPDSEPPQPDPTAPASAGGPIPPGDMSTPCPPGAGAAFVTTEP